jgi:hypothetical protein
MRTVLLTVLSLTFGFLTGLLLWALLLGAQARRHEPGLWTVRFARGLDCGLDYNGPPFTDAGRTLWLSCGREDAGWQLWPPPSAR